MYEVWSQSFIYEMKISKRHKVELSFRGFLRPPPRLSPATFITRRKRRARPLSSAAHPLIILTSSAYD